MLTRRGFLSLLGLGTAGLVLDPERLLWVPGQKTIFLPPTVRLVGPDPNIGMIVAEAWENVIRRQQVDNVFRASKLYADLWDPLLKITRVSPAEYAIRIA